jgi:hypothetical protein
MRPESGGDHSPTFSAEVKSACTSPYVTVKRGDSSGSARAPIRSQAPCCRTGSQVQLAIWHGSHEDALEGGGVGGAVVLMRHLGSSWS